MTNHSNTSAMDHEEIRSRIITLLKEKKRVGYKDLIVTIGCKTEEIYDICETLRLERRAIDIDGVGIEATDALYQIPKSITDPPHSEITSNLMDLDLDPPEHNYPEHSRDQNSMDRSCIDPSKLSIFISYGRKGQGLILAERLEHDLLDRKYNVYRDKNPILGLKGGYDWKWELEKQIEERSIFISLLTCHAVRRPDGYCLDEISLARSLHRKIIPLLIEINEDGKPCRPPLCIHRLNFLNYQNWKLDYNALFAELISAIHADQQYDGLSVRLLSGQGTLKMFEFDFTGEIGRKTKGFIGRSWLTSLIDTWLTGSEDQVFLLKGGPGTGKSAFLAHLVQHHPAVKAVHFCIRSHEATRNPEQFICSLASMIASQVPSYRTLLDSLVQSDSFMRKSPGDLLWNLIINPLEKTKTGQEQVLLVIDALDESVEMEKGQSPIVNLLSEQLNEKRFPPWIRFLISTRPMPIILSSFEKYPGCDLTESKPWLNEGDMKDYLKDTMTSALFQEAMQEKKWKIDPIKLQEMLLRASNGNFLYLTLVLEDIKNKKGYINPFERAFFPLGLSGYYQENFNRIYQNTRKYAKTRCVLDLILASREPLPIWLIGELLDITPNRVKELMDPIRSFFEIEGSNDDMRYRPFHSSFSEWLIGKKTSNDPPILYQVDLVEGHQLISWFMEKRYKDGIHDRFVLSHLPYHLFHAGRFLDYGELLFSFKFLDEKIRESTLGVQSLLEDFSWAEGSDRIARFIPDEKIQALKLIQSAIRLSAHVLVNNPAEIATQLYGRLLSSDEPMIQKFLDQVMNIQVTPWFHPITRSFTSSGGPLICILQGHTWDVNAVTVTLDSRYAVSGSGDNTLRVWNLLTRACEMTLEGHTSWVTAVTVTPDGRYAISGSHDSTLKVWDLSTGVCKQTFEGHTEWIRAVAVTPDGRYVISGSDDTTLRVWDLATGTCVKTLRGHTGVIYANAVTPDGRYVISGSSDATLKIWNIETGSCLQTFPDGTGSIRAVAVTPDGRHIVSGSDDKTLKIWDLETSSCIQTFVGHTEQLRAIAITPDGRHVISGATDKTLKIWNLKTGICTQTLQGHIDWIRAVAVTSDGRYVISGSDDTTLKMWDLKASSFIQTPQGHTNQVKAVVVTRDGRRAISGSYDKLLKVWDLAIGLCTKTLQGHTGWVRAVTVTNDNLYAVSGSDDNTIKVWDIATGKCTKTLLGHTRSVTAVSVTPDGQYAVSGSWDNTIKVWDLATGACKQTLRGHIDWVYSIAVTRDSRYIVSGSADETLKVWDITTGECTKTFQGHTGLIETVVVTADGQFAISVSWDNTLKVWNIVTGKCLVTVHGEGPIVACDISYPTTVIVGEETGRVHIFRLEGMATGHPVTTANEREDGLLSCKCFFCQQWFDLKRNDLGGEVSCSWCGKKMQMDPLTYREYPETSPEDSCIGKIKTPSSKIQ